MVTIEETDNSMTIFYSKSSGEIKNFATGIQDMNFYTNDKDDFSIIRDYVVLPKDDFVLKNIDQFKINLTAKTLELIAGSTLANYPVASS